MKREFLRSLIALYCLFFACLLAAPAHGSEEDFAAYYTRIELENPDPWEKVGRYADVVVRIDADRKVVFARDSSYLPCLVHDSQRTYFKEIVPRSGDGDAKRPDRINRYSYVRIIENTPDKVVVHWRYIPDFSNPEWDGVVDELFTIRPNGQVDRVVREGTPKRRDWEDPANRHLQVLRLSREGITEIHSKAPSHSARRPIKVQGRPVVPLAVDKPALHLGFDDALQGALGQTQELVSELSLDVDGHGAVWRQGVSGTALLMDGYASGVAVPASEVPAPEKELTVQAWVALGAYPFNWAPLAHQSQWEEAGYYLGVNALGQLGFMAQIDGKWQSIQATTAVHDSDLPLFQWHHVAATHDGETMRLFLDGKELISAPAAGAIEAAPVDLLVGLNTQKLKPTSPIRDWATYPSIFGIDGLIDEVVIHGKALSAEQIAAAAKAPGLTQEEYQAPDLEARDLPADPRTDPLNVFGARYRNLGFHAGFDDMWRVGDYPDVVVDFAESPCRLVFWKGLRFAPAMVTENGKWGGDQSAETAENWNKDLPFDHPESVGCAEHMSDAQARHSHVRVIENTPARALVHWRYAEIDVRYVFPFDDDGWGPWADEYYSIYPDGTAIRHVARNNGGWQETMFYNGPGTRPEDHVELEAYTLVNYRGEEKTYSWAKSPNPYPTIPGELELNDRPFVSMINFKSKWRPYYIYSKGKVGTFSGEAREGFSHFPWWNHYPVSQAMSDGRSAERPDRMTHSSLIWGRPNTDYLMYGLTDRRPVELLPLAKSWANSPELKLISGGKSLGYRMHRRDYLLEMGEGDAIKLKLKASKTDPVHNLCFTVNAWAGRGKAKVSVDGQPAEKLRQGVHVDTDGKRILVLFFELQSTKTIKIEISAEAS